MSISLIPTNEVQLLTSLTRKHTLNLQQNRSKKEKKRKGQNTLKRKKMDTRSKQTKTRQN